jgi:hypothetical protein
MLRMRKLLSVAIALVVMVALFPLSWRLADPLFSRPFPQFPIELPVLLIWPDHVEIRMVGNIAEVSPLHKDAPYKFRIDPDRQAWVEAAVRAIPTGNPQKSSWTIHIKQLGAGRQRVELEAMGDGISGMIYEAQSNEIVPLRWRYTGPGGAFVVIGIYVGLFAFIGLAYLLIRFFMRRRSRSTVSTTPGQTAASALPPLC